MFGLLLAAAAAALGIVALTAQDGADQSRVPRGSGISTDAQLDMRSGHVVGFVRDVNGRPVAGARVRLSDGRDSTRASRSGRFALRPGPGRWSVVATRRGYTQQTVKTVVRGAQGARVDFSLAVTAPDRVAVANSADRLIVWTGCKELIKLSEPELRRWIARGVDGFVCQTQYLRGLGGTQRFTGRQAGRGAETRIQRLLRSSPAVRLAKERKLLLYLGFYAASYFNKSTPFKEWFDDRGWSRAVLPEVRNLAAAARSMGFAGLAIDQELYPQEGGGETASWSTAYPGNRHGEEQARAKARQRGRQLMESMVEGYPGLELIAYHTVFPRSWQAKASVEINHQPDVYQDNLQIELWDGLSSVEGYSAIRWMDAFFYKTFQLPDASWDAALEFNANSLYSYLSRRFSNWSYASSRLHISPFSWVDAGPAEFDRAREPAHVAEQLEAFKRWGAGGSFANYAYGALDGFDYGPYENALRRASDPERVDRDPPRLQLTSPGGDRRLSPGETVSLSGVANDDFAIRAVRWYDDRGRGDVARLTWEYTGDQRSGWNGRMRWSIENLHVAPNAGHVTISAEDIHGLARQIRLAVVR